MRISAVNCINHTSFKGLMIQKDSQSDSWDYYGEKSGSSIDGHYVGSIDTDYYTYYPFHDETDQEIENEIKKNSYTMDYTTMGMGGGYECIIKRGKTLPYTKKEWEKFPEKLKERIKNSL